MYSPARMSGKLFVSLTGAALLVAVTGIILSARSDRDSAAAVTGAIGITGTVVVAILNLWHARWSQAASAENERSRIEIQHRHQLEAMGREQVLGDRRAQVEALRRSVSAAVLSIQSAHFLIATKATDGAMREELIARMQRVQDELAQQPTSERHVDVVLSPVSSASLRGEVRAWRAELQKLYAMVAKYTPPSGTAPQGHSARIEAFEREWVETYPRFEEASARLARALEDYASGSDMRANADA